MMGQLIIVRGPTGSGKTTLIHSIRSTLDPNVSIIMSDYETKHDGYIKEVLKQGFTVFVEDGGDRCKLQPDRVITLQKCERPKLTKHYMVICSSAQLTPPARHAAVCHNCNSDDMATADLSKAEELARDMRERFPNDTYTVVEVLLPEPKHQLEGLASAVGKAAREAIQREQQRRSWRSCK